MQLFETRDVLPMYADIQSFFTYLNTCFYATLSIVWDFGASCTTPLLGCCQYILVYVIFLGVPGFFFLPYALPWLCWEASVTIFVFARETPKGIPQRRFHALDQYLRAWTLSLVTNTVNGSQLPSIPQALWFSNTNFATRVAAMNIPARPRKSVCSHCLFVTIRKFLTAILITKILSSLELQRLMVKSQISRTSWVPELNQKVGPDL